MASCDLLRLPIHAHTVLVKGDAFVGVEHGRTAANHPIAKTDVGGDTTNLETPRLTFVELAVEKFERFLEKGSDVVRLQFAGLGAIHPVADFLHAGGTQ